MASISSGPWPVHPSALPSPGAPVAQPELAHGKAVGPATSVAVRREDLLFMLLGLDVLLPLLLAVAVLATEPAVVAHLGTQPPWVPAPHTPARRLSLSPLPVPAQTMALTRVGTLP